MATRVPTGARLTSSSTVYRFSTENLFNSVTISLVVAPFSIFLVVVNEHVEGSLATTGRHAIIVLEKIGTAWSQTHWVDFTIDHDLRPQTFFDDGAILDLNLSRDGINVRWVRLHG